jgi:hypothetical protein
MKVLLRNRKTKQYVGGVEEWTQERKLARDFGRSGQAIKFAVDKGLSDMEAVLTFDDPQYDIGILISPGPPGEVPPAGPGFSYLI